MPYPPFAARCLFKRVSRAFVLLAVLAFAPLARTDAASGALRASATPVIHTASGAVSGLVVQNMDAYLGIPYAAPPVGALRWQPPQPPLPWTATRAATTFANHCPQGYSPFGIATLTEDCLYLNVFVPAGTKPDAKLPVMLWLHGGGFTSGESNDYDPDRLVARGVIVVTINYRLGYLGFLATSGLDAEKHLLANYGLLDQQYALAWTHRNIAAFGGDPARTTVFGQSAGGESVFAQLLSPTNFFTGLFSRAIIESGAYEILELPSLAAAQTAGNAVAAALGCAPQDTACLRKVHVKNILALESSATPFSGGPSPAVDGAFLPLPPETALFAGFFDRVPIIQGSNHDEFRLFTAQLFDLAGGPLTSTEYPGIVQTTLDEIGLGAFTSQVLAEYPLSNYSSPDLAYSALTTDAIFSTPAYVTDVLLSAYTQLHAYEFSDENAPEDFLPQVSFPYGAAHGSELQFLFDPVLPPRVVVPPLSWAEHVLAATMVDYWTSFAKAARPAACRLPVWPQFNGLADDMESLVAPRPSLFFGFFPEHNVPFWTKLAAASQLPTGTLVKKQYLTLRAVQAAARTIRPRSRLF